MGSVCLNDESSSSLSLQTCFFKSKMCHAKNLLMNTTTTAEDVMRRREFSLQRYREEGESEPNRASQSVVTGGKYAVQDTSVVDLSIAFTHIVIRQEVSTTTIPQK